MIDRASIRYRFSFSSGMVSLSVIGLLITAMVFSGITLNQTLAAVFSLVVFTLWAYNRFAGAMAGMIFFMTKSLWVRLAFVFDRNISGSGGSDLLAVTAPLVLAFLIVHQIYLDSVRGQRLCRDRTRSLLWAFCGISLASVFLGSPIIGLAGFERNVLPNMMVLYLMAAVVNAANFNRLVKTLLVIGLISTVYGIGQYFLGLYPWEVEWFRELTFDEGLSGRLTVGLRGIEFRIFSIFFGYMDFFFTNVIIFALAISHKRELGGGWNKIRLIYLGSWLVILGLSLERMPLLMLGVIGVLIRYLGSSSQGRRRILWGGTAAMAVTYAILIAAAPYLNSSGADKLERLAELANPFNAESVDDRLENKWSPALETIKSNPLGVGIGYGSQTMASKEASESDLYVQPHNELIQKTLETGVLGATIYLLLLISVFRDSRRLNMGHFRTFGFSMLAISVGFWVCGLVNLPFSGLSGLTYWALCGAVLGLNDNMSQPETLHYEMAKYADNLNVV